MANFNGNRGYVGSSMSVRAKRAYGEGAKPISKWTKQDFLDAFPERAEQLGKYNVQTLRENLLRYDSWHHTGSMFNKTPFYALVDEEDIPEYEYWNVVESAPKKPKAEMEDDFYGGYYIEKKYSPSSGHVSERKVPFQNARKQGDWLVFEDGSKKLFSNMKVESRSKERTIPQPKPMETPRPKVKRAEPQRQATNPYDLFQDEMKKGLSELYAKFPKERVDDNLRKIHQSTLGFSSGLPSDPDVRNWKRETGKSWGDLKGMANHFALGGDKNANK